MLFILSPDVGATTLTNVSVGSDEVELVSCGGVYIEPQPSTTFTEARHKPQCRTASVWLDDFVLGGIEGAHYRILVWRVADGQMELSFETVRKEGVVQILTHSLRPVILSLGTRSGGVYVWAKEGA